MGFFSISIFESFRPRRVRGSYWGDFQTPWHFFVERWKKSSTIIQYGWFKHNTSFPKTKSLRLKAGHPQRKFHLTTINLQGQTVGFREGRLWMLHGHLFTVLPYSGQPYSAAGKRPPGLRKKTCLPWISSMYPPGRCIHISPGSKVSLSRWFSFFSIWWDICYNSFLEGSGISVWYFLIFKNPFVGRYDLGALKGNAPDHLNNVTCETWMLPRNIICISFAVFFKAMPSMHTMHKKLGLREVDLTILNSSSTNSRRHRVEAKDSSNLVSMCLHSGQSLQFDHSLLNIPSENTVPRLMCIRLEL